MIKDNKATIEETNLADKIYSPDIGSPKGKSIQSKLVPVTGNIAKILDELLNANEELKLRIDRLPVNSLNFATTIAHNLFCRSVA